jgi:hypothetical protein
MQGGHVEGSEGKKGGALAPDQDSGVALHLDLVLVVG